MRAGPAVLLLGLGLGLGLGGLPPAPAPAPRQSSTTSPGWPAPPCGDLLRGAPGLGDRGGLARLRLRRPPAPGGGALLSGSRGLDFSCARGRAAAPGWYRLSVRVRLRARRRLQGLAAPAHVDLHLAAPGGRLALAWFLLLPLPLRRPLGPLAWTFQLGLLGPGDARPARHAARAQRLKPRSVLPALPRPYTGFVAQTRCPVNLSNQSAMESSVSCQTAPCVIHEVRINRNAGVTAVRLTRSEGDALNATVNVDCPLYQSMDQRWLVFSVPAEGDVPDWNQPLDVSQLPIGSRPNIIHISPFSLSWGVYLFNFSVTITMLDPIMSMIRDSDSIYVWILRSPLVAVLGGDANITANYTDEVILDGSMSSDPEENNKLQGLRFIWYCTTNKKNYARDRIQVAGKDVCHPDQADLRWPQASNPVLTLSPGTLQGGRAYFFRMAVQKGGRRAFSDKTVNVLQRPPPLAHISCIENCGSKLIVSDRFSLYLNCTDCVSSDFYNWSIVSESGAEMPLDWAGQTVTGRNGAYLSAKAFAFSHLLEGNYWVSVQVTSWGGKTLEFKHPIILNRGPQIGECTVNPVKGIAFVTKFVVRCSNFTDKHIPLTYKIIVSDLEGIAEISSVKENTLGPILHFGRDFTTPPSFLPVGVSADGYKSKIFVQVYDSLGAFSQVTLGATVEPPTSKNSSKMVLDQLLNSAMGPNSSLSVLLQDQKFLFAGYLMHVMGSVLNNMKTESTLQGDKVGLRDHLFNQSSILPVSTLEEINQVVVTVTKLTQKASEFTRTAQKIATVRMWQANQGLQEYRRKDKLFRCEQIEIIGTGIFTSLSNIRKQIPPHEVVEDLFHLAESLADTILACMVPENKTAMKSASINMFLEKAEKQNVTQVFRNKKDCPNCFQATLNGSTVPGLPAKAVVSTMFCEFADDPFPWLHYPEKISTQVVGFRMYGAAENGDAIEITPSVVEVYLNRKNLTFAAFDLTVGPVEVSESLKKTTGGFSFEVDHREVKEVLVHIVTEVTVLFKVLVYAGSRVTPTGLVTTFLVPYDIPPIANQSDQFDPDCAVKEARVICLPASLLQVIAQHSQSPTCAIIMMLEAPRFVQKPSNNLVKIFLFSAHCLGMYQIQSDWREDYCSLGERTTWQRVHCVCKKMGRTKRHLSIRELAKTDLHTHFLMSNVTAFPNPVDLRLKTTKNVRQNPVTLFNVVFILLIYIILAFWALHRDEMDEFVHHHIIVLSDNDPYDKICYLVTVFTGSRWGSGTRSNVFIQLIGTEGASTTHCLSHPSFTTLYRGSINTFLLTTKSDLGDIHSIRVWHNNEGTSPSWYLSRIKVENLFSRHIWLFMCRIWLSVDTTTDKTFQVTQPDQPLRKRDFFLIDVSYRLGRNHLWFSIFASVVSKSFNRLQRLSCCLALLLSALFCNIMFFNLTKDEETVSNELRYFRSMSIGIKSTLITVPVVLLITFLFIHSQRKHQVDLDKVAPRKHPVMSEESAYWDDRLNKWHAHEAAEESSKKPAKPTSKGKPARPKASEKATLKSVSRQVTKETEDSAIHPSNKNFSNKNVAENEDVYTGATSSQEEEQPEKKPQIVLPPWCLYIARFLVFATSSISAFFIIFYGMNYSYNKSIEWLFASFCSFLMSVFVEQPCKIILVSGLRTMRPKYCKNIPWSTKYRYIQLLLPSTRMNPDEREKLHQHIVKIQGSRTYQPLTEDEIRIFQRKKRIKRRAFLFLSYILIHFIFLVLLLLLIVLLRHTDSFYYNQFIRDRFSVDLASVTKLEDIYRWLESVLVPLFHNDQNPTFLLDSSSKILGLPLMRQVRAKSGEKMCLPAANFVQNSNIKEIRCRPQYGVDPEDTKNYSSFWNEVTKRQTGKNATGFTYKPQGKRWVYYSYGLLHTYGGGGYAFYFFPSEQLFNSTVRLRELQGSRWLDEKTWAVVLELTTFNPDVNLFCSISVLFEVSQLGVVNTSISMHSFSLADFDRKTSAEIYLYVAILIFFLAYIIDEVYVITQERASYVQSVYNLLNLALKCIFTVLIVLFLRKHFLATAVTQFYLSNPEDFIPFHAVSQVDHTMRIILAFLLFLTILKTLRYSRAFYDVRLAQKAIQIALPGICHMAFVVSIYFFVYMAFGYLVFGQHEWNYNHLIHATQTIFSYCVAAFQNTEFSHNRVLGVLFLSSFMLVMICILINLFQAVILSAYEEMKQPVYEEPSDEVEAMTYLCRRLRTMCGLMTPKSTANDEPEFFTDMLYGQPEKKSQRFLGLKTKNISGKKNVYLVI
ncbi:polycystin family receptor for egg jelly-like [Lepus europaeus]|uniref:polycystin family receptor for egg jelly-like n=1 Tax=Lepus europaeus TaxID=9983 RepID=UPI002B477C54|nr:polycystin family receptor for egg jelly-like [Lepus europaeus]